MTVLGEQRSLKIGVADSRRCRNHSPAISHNAGNGFDHLALFIRDGNKVERGWPTPVNDFPGELDDYRQSIANLDGMEIGVYKSGKRPNKGALSS